MTSVELRKEYSRLENSNPKSHNSDVQSKKKGLMYYILLGAFFLLSLSIFKYIPILSISREIWLIFVLMYVSIWVVIKQILNRGIVFSLYELYLFIIMLLMPIYSALAAKIEFGQPLLPGVLTQRSMMIVGASLMLIYWVREQKIKFGDIERVLISLGWFCLIFYVSIDVLLDPAKIGPVSGFVSGGIAEPFHFIFNSTLIIYALLYYLNKGLINKNIFAYAKIIPFVFYLLLIDGGRSLIASLFAVVLFTIIRKASFFKIILWVPVLSLVLGVATASLFYFNKDYMGKFIDKFNDAVTVVVTREKAGDASANARIDEINLAMPYIEKNIFFGNGDLSHHWENGYLSKIGYYAPSDIGVVGVLYMFGIVGFIVFLMQFSFAWSALRKIRNKNSSLLIATSSSFLLYFFIHSLFTGAFVFSVSVSLMFISIIYAASSNGLVEEKRASV